MSGPLGWLRSCWSSLPPLGMLTLAAFVVCVASGVLLGLAYDPSRPQEAIALILLHNPVASAMRGAHWWSAQIFLVTCVLHVIEHVRWRAPVRLPRAVWLRTVLSLLAVAYAMLSGFILRGDPTAMQAERVCDGILRAVPLVGDLLAGLLLGPGGGVTAVYLHHIATATILIWLAAIEHARRMLPDRQALAWMLLLSVPPGLLLAPGLDAEAAAVEQAPWWLAGGQEMLRWLPHPQLALLPVLLVLAALAWLPRAGDRLARSIRVALAAAVVGYLLLSLLAWSRGGTAPAFRNVWQASTAVQQVPRIRGLREGCLACHAGMQGMAAAHDPAVIGCAVCHGGDRFSLDAATAHAGMQRTPGNLQVVSRTCATAGCHEAIATRVEGSLMNTMSGVVAVDRWVFGEAPHPDTRCDVRLLADSPADSHLRQLCASCHIGQAKEAPGPITESSRGGGCSACHLQYDGLASAQLLARQAGGHALPTQHPRISVDVPAIACFGCHSRSGRISTNFTGWAEVGPDATPRAGAATRQLEDGRWFERMPADVHAERGMTCIDCHIASEVMGDGRAHAHQEQAVRVACTDCHTDHPVATTTPDAEAAIIAALRGQALPGRRFVQTAAGDAYPNVWVEDRERIAVLLKSGTGTLHPKPPSTACGRNMTGHERVDCRTCHSAWTSQCITCHTAYDPAQSGWDHLSRREVVGTWNETGHDFRAEPPVLGVQHRPDGDRIIPTAPGMIMHREGPGGAAFHRLYAPVAPHTTVTAARSCASCHADPLALGYGRGRLAYDVANGQGTWQFTPALAAESDGLPADAWIPFLGGRSGMVATRRDVVPLDPDQQRRMLVVGSCLQCHAADEPRLRAVFAAWSGWRERIAPACVVPTWKQP